jgi:uncharacterized protein YjiS (DUF1127 family)
MIDAVRSSLAATRARHAANRAARRLWHLDNHMLRDIGLERGRIELLA